MRSGAGRGARDFLHAGFGKQLSVRQVRKSSARTGQFKIGPSSQWLARHIHPALWSRFQAHLVSLPDCDSYEFKATGRILVSMSKHRVPRWMNAVWLLFVLSLTCWLIIVAIRRDYDFVQTLGFLTLNFGKVFALAVVVGVVLYGLSILLEGLDAHKSHTDDDDHSGDMANLIP